MTQQTSPFLEGKYGWALGESGWNLGMDENLLKFSYMFDRNVDSIVASLPAVVNGEAHYLTTDNRLYFAVGGIFYSTPVPKWFEIVERSTGDVYRFDGAALNQIDSPEDIDTRLDAVELTLTNFGLNVNSNLVAGDGISLAYSAGPQTTTIGNTGVWERLSVVASVAGVLTLDLSTPVGFQVTLTENITSINFTNIPVNKTVSFGIFWVQNATGGYSVTFPGSVVSEVGGPLSQPLTAANSTTIQSFVTIDGGAVIRQAANSSAAFDITESIPVNSIIWKNGSGVWEVRPTFYTRGIVSVVADSTKVRVTTSSTNTYTLTLVGATAVSTTARASVGLTAPAPHTICDITFGNSTTTLDPTTASVPNNFTLCLTGMK